MQYELTMNSKNILCQELCEGGILVLKFITYNSLSKGHQYEGEEKIP